VFSICIARGDTSMSLENSRIFYNAHGILPVCNQTCRSRKRSNLNQRQCSQKHRLLFNRVSHRYAKHLS